jgi:hypothetical protein
LITGFVMDRSGALDYDQACWNTLMHDYAMG